MDSNLIHARFLVNDAFPGSLKALFSPQHGLYAEKQDNMKESQDTFDPILGIPIFSLYGQNRKPQKEQLSLIDILLVDLQDCGTRVYTYVWTLFLAMKECAKKGVAVAILDRPNPIGGEVVEGNILEEELFSFVGMAPLPMRHGMTMGELACFLASYASLDLDLYVVKAKGWQRNMYFDQTGLCWVIPSPNMPRIETAMVYPGQVILEGTNLSEGRGTTLPFEIFGAPYLDVDRLIKEIGIVEGAILRYQSFEPTFNKWQHQRCHGLQLHIIDRERFRPYRFTVNLLSALRRLQGQDFSWTPPPYEYDFFNLPADLIMGSKALRRMIESGKPPEEIDEFLKTHEKTFYKKRRDFLIY